MKNPAHPGRLIKNELDELGVAATEAARALGIKRQQLYNVIKGKSGVTPEMAIRLEQGIGSAADMWLRMQAACDLAELRRRKSLLGVKRLTRVA
jgi:addiction module HigA family antidote